jgi:hypothetical protein
LSIYVLSVSFPTPPSLLLSRPPNLACTLYLSSVIPLGYVVIKKSWKMKKFSIGWHCSTVVYSSIVRISYTKVWTFCPLLSFIPATQIPATKFLLKLKTFTKKFEIFFLNFFPWIFFEYYLFENVVSGNLRSRSASVCNKYFTFGKSAKPYIQRDMHGTIIAIKMFMMKVMEVISSSRPLKW